MNVLVFTDYDADPTTWADALAAYDSGSQVTVARHGDNTACPNTLDPVFSLARILVAQPDAHFDVAVGVGTGGWSAHMVALAGRVDALIVVDGLSGPFLDADERVQERAQHLRDRLFVNPTQPPRPHHDLDAAVEAAEAMPVPVTLVETPASPLTRDVLEQLAPHYASGATITGAADRTPRAVGKALGLI